MWQGTWTTIRKADLPKASTEALIAEYHLVCQMAKPRLDDRRNLKQERIDLLVDMLDERAEAGDAIADAFFRS